LSEAVVEAADCLYGYGRSRDHEDGSDGVRKVGSSSLLAIDYAKMKGIKLVSYWCAGWRNIGPVLIFPDRKKYARDHNDHDDTKEECLKTLPHSFAKLVRFFGGR
jgi:hypothetical protein